MWHPKQVRDTAIALLQNAITASGAQFSTSKDTPVEAGLTPSIICYTDSRMVGLGMAPPQFRRHTLLTVEVTVEGDDKPTVEGLSDTLCELVENTLLGTPQFVMLFEKIETVEWQFTWSGVNTERHTFTGVCEIVGTISERYEPTLPDLTGINIYVDSIDIADLAGTYTPPFNYPVAAAHREAGPDGRAEISGKIDL